MLDRLSNLLQRFDLRARVFYGGALQGITHFDQSEGVAHLHLVRCGSVVATGRDGKRQEITKPSALFYPRPYSHHLLADPQAGAEVVSASIEFGVGDENPLLQTLPDLLCISLAELPALDALQNLLFTEALVPRCGHNAVVDRLSEVLVVQMLRYAMQHQLVGLGLIAGLGDARLSKSLIAMHTEPARAWTLDSLAEAAGMSRSRFAEHFTRVMGMPAGEYLLQWRVGVAKSLLRRGRPVKQVAQEVGYGGSSTFGRAFSSVAGLSPTDWVRTQVRA